MTFNRLDNYLRTYRKRAGLTQSEIAFLLGRKSAAQFSRYERRRSIPTLRSAFACCLILGVTPEKLFAGVQEKTAAAVAQQIEILLSAFENKEPQFRPTAVHQGKLRWLKECKGRIQGTQADDE